MQKEKRKVAQTVSYWNQPRSKIKEPHWGKVIRTPDLFLWLAMYVLKIALFVKDAFAIIAFVRHLNYKKREEKKERKEGKDRKTVRAYTTIQSTLWCQSLKVNDEDINFLGSW